MNSTPTLLSIAELRLDGGTQLRDRIEPATVAEYAAALQEGADFPPIVVYDDGEHRWLADGFHRVAAHRKAGKLQIPALVHPGSRRDAVLCAAGANARHGLRRTQRDKRRSVQALLQDPSWSSWSDREIARRCGVDHGLVGRLRAELSGGKRQMERTVRRAGSVYTMRAARETTSTPAPLLPASKIPSDPADLFSRLSPDIQALLSGSPVAEDLEALRELALRPAETQADAALQLLYAGEALAHVAPPQALTAPSPGAEGPPTGAVPEAPLARAFQVLQSAPERREPVRPGQWIRAGRHRIFCGPETSSSFRQYLPASALAWVDAPREESGAEASAPLWLLQKARVLAVLLSPERLCAFLRGVPEPPQGVVPVLDGAVSGEGGSNWRPVVLFGALPDQLLSTPLFSDVTGADRPELANSAALHALLMQLVPAGEVVLVPQVDAGALLAAEVAGVTLFGTQPDPAHCRAIVAAWEAYTGQAAHPSPLTP